MLSEWTIYLDIKWFMSTVNGASRHDNYMLMEIFTQFYLQVF